MENYNFEFITSITILVIVIAFISFIIWQQLMFNIGIKNHNLKCSTFTQSQIPKMRNPPTPPPRLEPISFTPDQVKAMTKQRKKDKIKILEKEVERWKKSYFNSEKHISELNKKNIPLLQLDENDNILKFYSLEPERFENKPDKIIEYLSEMCKNAGLTIEEVAKAVTPPKFNPESKSYILEKERQELIIEIESSLTEFHDVLWDTPYNSKLSERFINAMNKQNLAIQKLLKLCKQHNS